MLKTTLKAPKTDKVTKGIIGACHSASDIAKAIHAFWGNSAPGEDEKFIIGKLAALFAARPASEADIAAFTQMNKALMGGSLKAAKEDMFGSSTLLFLQFAQLAAEALGVSWMDLSDQKIWKFFFLSGDAFRVRPAVQRWNDAETTADKDAAALALRELIEPLETNGSFKAPAYRALKATIGDLLGGNIMTLYSMMKVSTEEAAPETITQQHADVQLDGYLSDGKSLLSGLSNPADIVIADAKSMAGSLLDQGNADSLEWLNIKTFFGPQAEKVKAALITGRYGYGSPYSKDGCQNFINSGPSGGAAWLKEFMDYPISKVTPVIDELRDKILAASAVDDASAAEWVKGVKISPSLIKEYDAYAGKPGQFVEDLKAVFRLAGGRIQTLTSITLCRSRSFATSHDKSISLNPRGGKKTLWHEVGHHFEFSNPDYLKLARAFLTKRAGGDRNAIAPLNQFFKNNYGMQERAITDNFASPYVGKVYASQRSNDVHDAFATEVFSSGFEYLAVNKSGATSLLNGDEVIEFVTGVLKGVHKL